MMNHAEQLGEAEILKGCEIQAVLVEYVFMGKEDSAIFYVLFLNQEHFTKDDVIRMAQSVQFTEKAF